MCGPLAIPIAMAAASAAQSAMAAKDAAKAAGAAEDQQRKQKMELIKGMNIKNQDLTLQDKQNLQDTLYQKSENNLQAVKAMGSVRAAIGESMLRGHSMERIQRDTEGQLIRANAGLQENYERDYSKIYIQREQNKVNTAAQIKGMAPVQMPDKTAELVGGVAKAGAAFASSYAGGMGGGGAMGALSSGMSTVSSQGG